MDLSYGSQNYCEVTVTEQTIIHLAIRVKQKLVRGKSGKIWRILLGLVGGHPDWNLEKRGQKYVLLYHQNYGC